MANKSSRKISSSSLTKRRLQNFYKDKMAVLGSIGVIAIILICICAPLLTDCDPAWISLKDKHLPKSWEHPLGTDFMGRDIFARIIYGGRWSIAVGVIASLSVTIVGSILGAISGFFGGIVDKILVTLQEYLNFFPQILLILLFVAISGEPSVSLLILIWTCTGWGSIMRIVRGRIMSLKEEPYIESCRANGISSLSIMLRHILPNTMGPIIVSAVGGVSGYMLQEAALAYLGLGLPPDIATWGNIINAAKDIGTVTQHPIMWLAPGISICIFTVCMTFFGNGLRDALDPTTH